jgi:hypothetical protein
VCKNADENCRSVVTLSYFTKENTDLQLLSAFASAGMCLPSRCLAMSYSGFQASCHNINTPINIGYNIYIYILRHTEPLLGGDREIGDFTAAVARQRPANNRGMVFSVQSVEPKIEQQQSNDVFCAGRDEML